MGDDFNGFPLAQIPLSPWAAEKIDRLEAQAVKNEADFMKQIDSDLNKACDENIIDEELRLQCLRMAATLSKDADAALGVADRFFNFLKGKK